MKKHVQLARIKGTIGFVENSVNSNPYRGLWVLINVIIKARTLANEATLASHQCLTYSSSSSRTNQSITFSMGLAMITINSDYPTLAVLM